ncbi:MAG TPA: ABC transporter permease, partial [Methylomirabilota bacterium]
MEVRSEGVLGTTVVAPHRLRWSRQVRRVTHSVVVVAGALCVALIVAVALFAGSIAPQDPDEQNFDLVEARPGAKALFGTDRFGRDVLSRVIHGSRISLYVALTSISVAMALGGVLGLTAGYLGGTWDNLINRVLDVFFSIPGLLLSVGIAAMRGPGVNSAVIAIAIVY